MKVLHLMRNEKFTKSVSMFYNEWFNNGEHDICYVNKKGETQYNLSYTIKQFEIQQSNLATNHTIAFLKEYDYIVLHSFFIETPTMLKWSLFGLLPKIVWIEWGFDLYDYKQYGRLSFIKNKLYYFFRNSLHAVVCIFEPDVKQYKKEFPKSKAQVFYAPYCGPKISPEYEHYSSYSRLAESNEKKDTIYIQVGHSATSGIKHFSSLKRLEKFKDENIKIFIPLSYGDSNNAVRIKAYARSMFAEDKLIIVDEFLPSDKYFDLLRRIDIAIFETERQIGLGNIYRLIFRNTKLYLSNDSVMLDYFASKGVPVMAAESIDESSFDEFRRCVSSSNKSNFDEYIRTFSDFQKKLDYWTVVYKALNESVMNNGYRKKKNSK